MIFHLLRKITTLLDLSAICFSVSYLFSRIFLKSLWLPDGLIDIGLPQKLLHNGLDPSPPSGFLQLQQESIATSNVL